MQHAEHMQLEHVAELVGVALANGTAIAVPALAISSDTGPARRHRLLDAVVHSFRVGDVGDHVARGLALPHHVGQRLFVAAGDGDGGAGLGQRRRDGAADAASAASHQCVLSRKRSHMGAWPPLVPELL